MTQTIRKVTSSISCDIYYHPNSTKPNGQERFKYTVIAREISWEDVKGYFNSKELTEEDWEEIGANSYLQTLIEKLATGYKYRVEADLHCGEIYYARNLKEVRGCFSNFFC